MFFHYKVLITNLVLNTFTFQNKSSQDLQRPLGLANALYTRFVLFLLLLILQHLSQRVFLFKKNKHACTSIWYTRVLLNSFTFHNKGSFDLWRSFELGNAIICKILFVFTTSEITAPILSSLLPCRSSGSSRITFLGGL